MSSARATSNSARAYLDESLVANVLTPSPCWMVVPFAADQRGFRSLMCSPNSVLDVVSVRCRSTVVPVAHVLAPTPCWMVVRFAADPTVVSGRSCARSNSLMKISISSVGWSRRGFQRRRRRHAAGDADDLAAQFVAASTGRRFPSRLQRARLEPAISTSSRARPSQTGSPPRPRRRQEALPLLLDVAKRLPIRRLGLGLRQAVALARARRSASVRRSATFESAARELVQQGEDDQRRDGAVR